MAKPRDAQCLMTLLLRLLVCCGAVVLPAHAQQPLEQVTLQLKWRHAFQFAGYYAAIEQGYYAEAGFEVELREMLDGRSPTEQLLTGEADFAITGSEIVIHRAQGAPVVALATIFQHSPYGFLVRADSGIETVEDFAGKRIMLNSGIQDADLLATLRIAGLDDADYIRQPTSFDALSLLRDETDVFNAYVTDQRFRLKEAGVDGVYILPQLYGVDFYSDILVTTEQRLQAAPERVQAFRDASLRGWRHALQNMDEVIDLILARYNTQGLSRAHLEYEASSSREMILPLIVHLGYMNPERWESIRRIFVEEGVLPPDSRIDGLLYDEAAQGRKLAEWLTRHRMTLLATATLLLFALLGAAMLHARRLAELRTTELADQERQLQQQNQRLQQLLEAINGASWEYDLGLQRFTYVSPNLQRLTGYSQNDLRSMADWLQMIVEEDRDEAQRNCMTEVAAGRDHVFEYRLRKPDGKVVTIMDVVRVLTSRDGSPERLAGFMVDVSERKLAERALRRTQKMDAVGQLTGGIAHDFNNILGIIQGNLELMEQQLEQPVRLQEHLANLQHVTKRATRLTQQLLGFSRLRSEYVEVANMNELIERMRELAAGSVTPEISVRIEAGDALWPVCIDTGDFENALLNLVLNARDAMPRGGELLIRTENVGLAAPLELRTGILAPGDYVLLTVSDTGGGMSPEVLERMFEPFFTTREPGLGSGLGLPMVFGFVQRSGGQIDVSSQLGAGSSFTLYLPRTQQEPAAPAPAPGPQPESVPARERILVVDDEDALLNLTATRLRRQGYEVFTAGDALQALQVLEREPEIRLLFSDVLMPGGMNGFELAECAMQRYPDLKLLLTTGFSDEMPTGRLGKLTSVRILHKPYQQQELLERIRQALDGSA